MPADYPRMLHRCAASTTATVTSIPIPGQEWASGGGGGASALALRMAFRKRARYGSSMSTDTATQDCRRLEQITARNVQSVFEIDHAANADKSVSDRLADRITAFCGSMRFVWTHVVWFTAWIGWNMTRGAARFDPFPFQLLTLVVSLEAIFLSAFILVSENRQARIAERRNHLDLQVNLLAEQENTKMLKLLVEIARRAGVDCDEAELAALAASTDPNRLAAQIERTEHDQERGTATGPATRL